MPIKSIPISIAVFILTLIAFIAIFIIFISILSDNCGNICGGKTIIPLIIFSLVIIIPLAFLIIKWRGDKISTGVFIGTIISLIILLILTFGFIFLFGSGTHCSPYWKSTMPNINSLRVAQEIFFSENDRYADTQEELIEAGIMNAKVKFFDDNRIEKEFTDKDGNGIEGGDNDPKTWSATAYIPSREVSKWCMLISNGYWYTCDQDGCRKEK